MDPELRPRNDVFGAAPGGTSEPEPLPFAFGPGTFLSRIVRLMTTLATIASGLGLVLFGWGSHQARFAVLGIGVIALVLVAWGVMNRLEPRMTSVGLILGTAIHLIGCAAMIALSSSVLLR